MDRGARQGCETVDPHPVLRPRQIVAAVAQHVDALEPDIDRQPRCDGDAVGEEKALGDGDGALVLIGEQAAVGGADRLRAIAPAVGRPTIGIDAGIGLGDAIGAVIEPQPGGDPVAPACSVSLATLPPRNWSPV